MRALYQNQIVDYNDGNTEFVKEFNDQIASFGAIAYNHTTNTYQYIRKFQETEFINEILPWYFYCRPSILPNGIDVEMVYEFDPKNFEDEPEILALWQEAIEEGQPQYDYDEDGEIYTKDWLKMTNDPTRHTLWIISREGKDLIDQQDQLMIYPMIKNLNIAKEIIRNHTIKPFEE